MLSLERGCRTSWTWRQTRPLPGWEACSSSGARTSRSLLALLLAEPVQGSRKVRGCVLYPVEVLQEVEKRSVVHTSWFQATRAPTALCAVWCHASASRSWCTRPCHCDNMSTSGQCRACIYGRQQSAPGAQVVDGPRAAAERRGPAAHGRAGRAGASRSGPGLNPHVSRTSCLAHARALWMPAMPGKGRARAMGGRRGDVTWGVTHWRAWQTAC